MTTAPACNPERILFFDDSAENVAGARRVGMRAVEVASIDDVRRALAPLLRSAPAGAARRVTGRLTWTDMCSSNPTCAGAPIR